MGNRAPFTNPEHVLTAIFAMLCKNGFFVFAETSPIALTYPLTYASTHIFKTMNSLTQSLYIIPAANSQRLFILFRISNIGKWREMEINFRVVSLYHFWIAVIVSAIGMLIGYVIPTQPPMTALSVRSIAIGMNDTRLSFIQLFAPLLYPREYVATMTHPIVMGLRQC